MKRSTLALMSAVVVSTAFACRSGSARPTRQAPDTAIGAGAAASTAVAADTPSAPAQPAGAAAGRASGVPASPMGMRNGMMAGMGMMGGGAGSATKPTGVVATPPACPPIAPELIHQGKSIFTGKGNCYTCHGSSASGTPLAPSLADKKWLNIDGSYEAIAGLVTTGVPQPKEHPAPMPPKGGADLSTAEVCAVAAYVYSLSH